MKRAFGPNLNLVKQSSVFSTLTNLRIKGRIIQQLDRKGQVGSKGWLDPSRGSIRRMEIVRRGHLSSVSTELRWPRRWLLPDQVALGIRSPANFWAEKLLATRCRNSGSNMA